MSLRLNHWSPVIAVHHPTVRSFSCYICRAPFNHACGLDNCASACRFLVAPCGHGYHGHCLQKAQNKNCTICSR
ncbi:Poxvirus APC/cyclosome regulator [Western grey kangaroopox virus]|uniref:Poxvirus APC/cyclosome regulator n=2 Tax=Macropopoxvirus TaxID=2733295 RepID=A0A2C9DT00_9POXV|nr:Poxvirus APC/cyclosome regulator [Western grey kangaroopox virus]YP_010085323.1 Poxvirus APC/cyclosome regulator [Eastern grey kangaroopox virus]ATI20969.1 Poxvirus APC/cyclosome regulator [Western grey kangaroopox virus]ATI21133.1 Poxvirus APC/cyclosome regulator [Eastern grey kangaroopox virus]ATX75032.1 poxvirus APC/cyclosome regulator [Eastern grey kangaroopox virus]